MYGAFNCILFDHQTPQPYVLSLNGSFHVPPSARVPLRYGEFTAVGYSSSYDNREHVAFVFGDIGDGEDVLVRVHSECLTGDVFHSLRCDFGEQLESALAMIEREGRGVLLYLAQEGRGIGLVNKLRAYALQDRGLDTLDANRALGWDADERRFLAAAAILDAVGVRRARLLTNNPDKVAGLAACGIEVVSREPLVIPPNGVDDHYLATKARRLGHLL